jgi:carboxymethylenebutenolidase
LVLFVRIGAFQWVTAIPNKKILLASQVVCKTSQNGFPLLSHLAGAVRPTGGCAGRAELFKVMAIASKKPDPEVISDLDATLAFAKASGSADVARVAVVGFCWGGRQVWLYAAHNPELKAAVASYGPLSWLGRGDAPDITADLNVPVLAFHGRLDSFIPSTQIEAMKTKLAAAGVESKLIVYSDAGHGFFADYRPDHKRTAAEASWAEAAGWLKEHGV